MTMRRLSLFFVVALTMPVVGCDPDVPGSAMPDGGPPIVADTFPAYVVALVQSENPDTAAPRPASEFENLPDDESPEAFQALFP